MAPGLEKPGVRVVETLPSRIDALALSNAAHASNKVLAVAYSAFTDVWTGSIRIGEKSAERSCSVSALAWFGDRVAVAHDDGVIALLDPACSEKARWRDGGRLTGLSAQHDLLAASATNRLLLYSTDGAIARLSNAPALQNNCVKFHPEQPLLATGNVRRWTVFDTREGTLQRTVGGESGGAVRAVEWIDAHTLATAGDGGLQRWDLRNPATPVASQPGLARHLCKTAKGLVTAWNGPRLTCSELSFGEGDAAITSVSWEEQHSALVGALVPTADTRVYCGLGANLALMSLE
jgi:hypothetical protein